MVPVWLQTPVGAKEGWWDFEPRGGVVERNMEPLSIQISDAPDTTCHCLTAPFQRHSPNLLHQLSHSTSIDATDSDLYPGQCVHPPSPCINIDRLTRSHQRPYRCFLPAPALDAPDQRPISAPSQTRAPSPIWAAPCQSRKVGHVLFRPCCLFHPHRGQTNWRKQKPSFLTLVLRGVCGMRTRD